MFRHTSAIERFYSGLRLLSIDVAFAALGGGVMATRVIGAYPRISFYWLLPVGVWVAYTTDHLLDARRMGPNASTPRHRFHHEHMRSLSIAVILLSLVCAIGGWIGLSMFGIEYAAIMCGLVLLHEAMIYLVGNRASPLLIKELGVAIVFTAGVWGMPWLRHRHDTGHWLGWPIVLMLQYFLLALVNLLEFSIYECRIDTADEQTSFVRGIGRRRAVKIVGGLLVVQPIIAVLSVIIWKQPTIWLAEGIFLAMTIGLWIVMRYPRFSLRAERYRSLGDGVFLLPLLMLVMR
jgi:hypothetical protein